VTEALRHLFSAQKAAALESKDNAKKLSLQQQVRNIETDKQKVSGNFTTQINRINKVL
jgi:hypothetical protein